MAKQLRNLEAQLEEERKQKQTAQRDAKGAHASKNRVLQQSKDLQNKIKVLEAGWRTAEAERDELAKRLVKRVLALDEKRQLDTCISTPKGELEEEKTQSKMMMERARKAQINIEQLTRGKDIIHDFLIFN